MSPALCLALALAAHTAEPSPAWSFRVATAQVGAPLYYRLAWTNRGDAPVRVPADLLARHTLQVSYCPPRGCRGARTAVGIARVRSPSPPRADTVAWTTVAPGDTVEVVGDLSGAAPEQCNPRGCAAGTYTVHAAVPPRDFSGLADDQTVPSEAWTEEVKAVVPLLPVHDEAAVSLAVRFTRAGKGLRAAATLTNRLAVPLWIPGRSAVFAECPATITLRDGSTTLAETRNAAGGQSPYDEGEGQLLAPGAKVTLTYHCALEIPAGARHVEAALRLVPFRPFAPTRATTPLHFVGTARSPMTQVL